MPLNKDSSQQIIIKKSNELIQARYKLTKEEQRLILLLASQIHKDDEDFKSYEIRVADFVSMFGLEKRKSIYAELEESSRRLTGRTIELSQGEKKRYASWLSYVEYIEGSGTIRIEFHNSLKPYLLQLKDSIGGFTKYRLSTVMNFSSSYSIRLYELLKMEVWKAEKAGKTQFEKTFEMEEYRKLLGIEKKAYPIFANFRIRVIEPTVQEITEQTDLEIFETRYIKTGRKITGLCFIVIIKDEKQVKAKAEEEEQGGKQEIHKAVQALIDNGFSFENARTYKTKYGIKQIERNLAYMQAEERNGKKIENRPAYLASAIREDWGQYREAEMKAKAEKEAKRKEAERKAVENQTTLDQQIEMSNEKLIEDFLLMDEEKKKEIINNFLNSLYSMIRTGVENDLKESGMEILRKRCATRSYFIDFLKTYDNGL